MKDAIGNKIDEGSLLWWHKLGVPVKVTKVVDGGLSLGNGREVSPAFLHIEVQIGVDMTNAKNTEPILSEFLRVMDPNNTAILDKLVPKLVRPQ